MTVFWLSSKNHWINSAIQWIEFSYSVNEIQWITEFNSLNFWLNRTTWTHLLSLIAYRYLDISKMHAWLSQKVFMALLMYKLFRRILRHFWHHKSVSFLPCFVAQRAGNQIRFMVHTESHRTLVLWGKILRTSMSAF